MTVEVPMKDSEYESGTFNASFNSACHVAFHHSVVTSMLSITPRASALRPCLRHLAASFNLRSVSSILRKVGTCVTWHSGGGWVHRPLHPPGPRTHTLPSLFHQTTP